MRGWKGAPIEQLLLTLCLFSDGLFGQRLFGENRRDENAAIAEFIRDSFLNFGDYLSTGVFDLQVPSLEPLAVKRFQYVDITSSTNLTGIFGKIQILGLSSLVVDSINVNLSTKHLEAKFSIPELRIEGSYRLEGSVSHIFPVWGEGNFTILVEGAVGWAAVGLRVYPQRRSLDVGNFRFAVMSPRHLRQNFAGLLGGGGVGAAANRMLRRVGNKVYGHVRLPLEKSVGETVRRKFVQILRKIDANGANRKKRHEISRRETNPMNEYLDVVLFNLRTFIRDRDLEPFPLPPMGPLHEGLLFGISSIRRLGNAIVDTNDSYNDIRVEMTFDLNNISAVYSFYAWPFVPMKGLLEVSTDRLSVFVSIIIGDGDFPPILDSLELMNLGKMAAHVTNWGPLDGFSNPLLTRLLNAFEPLIRKELTSTLANVFQTTVLNNIFE